MEGGDEGGWFVIVDLFDGDAGGDFVRAVGAGEGGDLVFAGFDEFFGDVFAY